MATQRAKILSIVNDLVTARLQHMTLTDVVMGTIETINPISISIMHGSDTINLPQELIDIDELPPNVKVGDKFRFLRYNSGKRFLPLNAYSSVVKSLTEQIQALQTQINNQ